MTRSLHDQTIMISGGSFGIGYATAERLGSLGARISICGRREQALRDAAERLQNKGIQTVWCQADVSVESDVERWFSATEQKFGPPAVLVNNAGVEGHNPISKLTEEQWDHTMRINCRGPFLCAKRAAPAMIEARRGRLIFISSVAALYYRKDISLYFASKWALNGFAHCVAKELSEYNIHVHIICPGMTETNFFDALGGRLHPTELNYVHPEQVAELVEYACCLDEQLDTLEFSIFPRWQLKNFGIRR